MRDEGGAGMVGVILLVETEATDRADLRAVAKCRLLEEGFEKQARYTSAVVGIDRRRKYMEGVPVAMQNKMTKEKCCAK